MKLLLLGSSGYIGGEFLKQVKNKKLPCVILKNSKQISLKKLQLIYEEEKFTHIINCSGYTGKPNVDSCEKDKNNCIIGNCFLPYLLKEFSELKNLILCHISSGCIYQGKKPTGQGFSENDPPNFDFNTLSSFYSGTKSLAESVLKQYEKSYIWRLRIPFEENDNPRNYLSKLLNYEKLLNAENSVSNKSEFVSICIESMLNAIPYGIYNIVNDEPVETVKVVDLLKKYFKNKNFEFFKDEADFYNNVVALRSNCVLDNSKIKNQGIKVSNSYESIETCLVNWRKK